MSKISSDECFAIDMEWYGVDRQGNIAVFCSAGEGYLPEFVCEDKERADELIEYFNAIERITDSVLLFIQTEYAQQVAKDFSDRICTLHNYYTKQSYPLKPLKYEMLPNRIREILKHNFMEIEDFLHEDTIHIKHAYE